VKTSYLLSCRLRGAALCALSVLCVQASPSQKQLLRRLPLRFEANDGRASHAGVKYFAHGPNFELDLAASQTWLEWRDAGQSKKAQIHTVLAGANPNARIEAADRLAGSANYLVGDRTTWRTGVAGFGRVRYQGVYPGIDFVFHGEEGKLEYDFLLAPHADPRKIRLELDGQSELRLSSDGDLIVATPEGEIRWKKPVIYQDVDGVRRTIEGKFAIRGSAVQFELGPYDESRALVIDPTVKFSTYLGGENNEAARGVAMDGAGNIYLAGVSSSPDLPTLSAYQPNFAGRTALSSGVFSGDGFVAKFSPAGALIYLTYLGGSRDDGIAALAVDSAGNAYVTGATNSPDFPVVNAYQPRFGGNSSLAGDAFVAKLSPDGTKLIFSTYLGGTLDDIGLGIALDGSGNIFICGASASLNFPLMNPVGKGNREGGTGGEPLRHFTDTVPEWEPGDGFVAEFDKTGQLLFSTYLGGVMDDAALSIAVDSSSNVYVGGCTLSFNFPVTAGSFQQAYHGQEVQNEFFHMGDGFVTKINPATSTLVYSTFFGGNGDDCVTGIALDATGAVYLTGTTSSTDLPVTAGAAQPGYAGYRSLPFLIAHLFGDAFAAKLDPTGTKLQYLTYIGGSQNDGGTAIAVDAQGDAYVFGFTDSSDFPLAGSPMQSKMAGDGGISEFLFYGDAFLTIVNPTGTALVYSTYFGGNEDDRPFGILLDGSGNVILAGNTVSTNFPTTQAALQKSYGGYRGHANGTPRGDAFLTVLTGFPTAPPLITKVANAEGGESPTIAPNTWVEIKGTNLSGSTRTWAAGDFVNNLMPTDLDGVSVTMNGKPAYVYYISSTQINVLSPPDLGTGPVQVQVSVAGIKSGAFTAQSQQESISFFVFDGTHVIATHLDGSLIGPASLYPGISTPARPGETIILYANGYGPVNPPVVAGSITQAGSLPSLPPLQIGPPGALQVANVTFAGLISPGLYQFNVEVPSSGLINGDNQIQSEYGGQVTPSGLVITIQN